MSDFEICYLRPLNPPLPSPPAPLPTGEGRVIVPIDTESGAGSSTDNGRRRLDLLLSRFGLDTSEASQGHTVRRLHRADRPDSPARPPFRPPAAILATTTGRSDRLDGCGQGTAEEPATDSPRPLVRPPRPANCRAPAVGRVRRWSERSRPRPIASRSGRTLLPGIRHLTCNLPSRRILP